MKRPLVLLSAALAVILAAPSPARADVEVEIAFGHGGTAVSGAITPFRVEIASTESAPLRIEIEARTGSARVSGEVGSSVDVVAPGARKVFTFLLRSPLSPSPAVDLRFDRDVVVRFGEYEADGDEIELQLPPAAGLARAQPAKNPVFLAVGRGAKLLPGTDTRARYLPLREEDLPLVWEAYDGIEAVLWIDPARDGSPDPASIRALRRWVELGGRLVLSATRRPEVLDDLGFADFLPARPKSPEPNVSYLAVARALARATLGREDSAPQTGGPVTPLEFIDGTIHATYRDEPLVVSARRGLGEVVVLGYDLRRFADAKGGLALDCLRFLAPDVFRRTTGQEQRGSFLGSDSVDEIGKLLRTGGVKAPPMGLLSLFMILYVLAVGPIDYLILKKYKLLKYSALTFLGLAVVFSAAAWFVSFWLFGGKTLVNRVTLVDIVSSTDPAIGDRLRIVDFAGHYAPRGGTRELEADGETVHFSDLAASWVHMGGTSAALPRDPVRLQMNDPARPVGSISLPFRALRTIRGEVYRERTLPLDVAMDEDGRVRIRNGLPYRLRDPVLVGRRGISRLDDLEPGAEIETAWVPGRVTRGSFAHGLESNGYLPDPERLGAMGDGDVLDESNRRRLARALQALSVQSTWADHTSSSQLRDLRILRQVGLDRGEHVRADGMFLLAWTDEPDPFGLPGGDEPGFRVTLLRKVVQR